LQLGFQLMKWCDGSPKAYACQNSGKSDWACAASCIVFCCRQTHLSCCWIQRSHDTMKIPQKEKSLHHETTVGQASREWRWVVSMCCSFVLLSLLGILSIGMSIGVSIGMSILCHSISSLSNLCGLSILALLHILLTEEVSEEGKHG